MPSLQFCEAFSCLGQHTDFAVRMATLTMPGFLQATGDQTTFMIVAKDANGVQKSLGGDRFAVSWCHNGTKACTTGKLLVSSMYILCLHVLKTFPVSTTMSTGDAGHWSRHQEQAAH